jgi:hypothetical protein
MKKFVAWTILLGTGGLVGWAIFATLPWWVLVGILATMVGLIIICLAFIQVIAHVHWAALVVLEHPNPGWAIEDVYGFRPLASRILDWV